MLSRTAPARHIPWALAAALSALAAAAWLRQPGVPALAGCVVATLAAAALTRIGADRGRWRAGFVASAALFCALAAASQRAIERVGSDWETYAADLRGRALASMRTELARVAEELRAASVHALRAPADPAQAARQLASIAAGQAGDRGVVLYRGGAAAAWGGRMRMEADTLQRPFGAGVNAFYLVMYAVAVQQGELSVAAATVHAEPPAGRLAPALDAMVASRAGVSGFEFGPPQNAAGDSVLTFAPGGGRALFSVRPRPLLRGEVLQRLTEQARVRGALALGLALVCFTAALWRRRAELRVRLLALVVALAVVGVVPLNALSNVSQLFDPSFYFASLGGPYTASVGALGLSSGLLLLALLAVLRSPIRFPSRWVALLVVLAIAGTGPFLLRDLSRGISSPTWGVSVRLWLAWEVTLFLAAVSLLLAGASAGRAALGGRRGLPLSAAPLLAGFAALLAPLILDETGRWPGWYPGFWITAMVGLAFTRRARGIVIAAAAVAAFGAATLVWGATARQRVQLAERDIEGLGSADEYAKVLLDRFQVELTRDAPASRAELLQRYVTSDLAAAGYLPRLTSWAPGAAAPSAELAMSPVADRPPELAQIVGEARASGRPVMRSSPGLYGVQLVLAVPDDSGAVTAVVVPPRSRLAPDDPFSTLLGLAPELATEPPFTLSLVEADPSVAAAAESASGPRVRWQREGNELHGDRVIRIGVVPTRAHVEVELRPADVLIQRGVLVVLLDLGIVAALWTLSALADGGFGRWMRARGRGWSRSYRARLTLALFTFFVVPAVAFAVWSYRRLQGDDMQSRELLVLETLRAVTTADDFRQLEAVSDRLDTPLLLYEGGQLLAASDTLYEALAPTGRFLPPPVFLRLGLGDEVTARSVEHVGGLSALFGYRAVPGAGSAEGRLILAAPARTNEVALDRRRRDLGVLVLFATALGALAALWLSGIAAREFARPIGALREAALAVAAGEREPVLGGEPPSEFEQVFSAFRRMASDLDASRSALEEAQRRTAAVLRNVASGVVAVDPAGTVSLANPRADALLGERLPPGTPLSAVAPPELVERIASFVEEHTPLLAATSGETRAEEEEFDLQLDGRQLHARLTRLLRGGGGAVVTLDDVTEVARAQRVLAWGEMARQVAHEIKNPLTPIRLGVQHLRRARADGRADFDKILERNVERILAEIDRLDEIARAFSRYGTAPAERPAAAPTDVAAVTRDVVALERMGVGGVQWALEGADDPALALAREEELREVLLNVLENARLAHARTVAVAVACDDGRVRIAVRDDGEGIPPEVLPRIFEPHFSTRTSGSGLGLAISRRIIDGWGGEITVASRQGEGTEVTISLVAGDSTPA